MNMETLIKWHRERANQEYQDLTDPEARAFHFHEEAAEYLSDLLYMINKLQPESLDILKETEFLNDARKG